MQDAPLFYTEADRPCAYRVRPGVVLLTEEVLKGPIRWSRFVQGTYHHDRGFLSSSAVERVPIAVLFHDEGTNSYLQCYDKDWITKELNKIIIPNTLTAIHYVPGVRVDSVMVGLPMDTEDELPERFKFTLPRPS